MALEAQNNPFTSILMVGAADPEALSGDADPSAGSYRLVMGTDDKLYILDETGNAVEVGAAAGAVATDAIWDAAGDLAVGSGANTAAKLTKGSDGTVLTVTAGAVGWASPGSGGALVLLEQHTASASATLDFTTFISSTYDDYIFTFLDVRNATDNQGFFAQVGTGGDEVFFVAAQVSVQTRPDRREDVLDRVSEGLVGRRVQVASANCNSCCGRSPQLPTSRP